MEVSALVGPEEIVGINTQVNLSRPQDLLASWQQATGSRRILGSRKPGPTELPPQEPYWEGLGVTVVCVARTPPPPAVPSPLLSLEKTELRDIILFCLEMWRIRTVGGSGLRA